MIMRFLPLVLLLVNGGLGTETGTVDLLPHLIETGGIHMTQEMYDTETTNLEAKHMCRWYRDSVAPPTICIAYCETKTKLKDNHFSTCEASVSGLDIWQEFDPDGRDYYLGNCNCKDIPLARILVHDLMIALPRIAEIGCSIIFDSLQLVLDAAAAAIPGPGEAMAVGMKAGLQAAKTVAENGGDAMDFAAWFTNPCGNNKYTNAVDQLFDPMSSVPDDVVPGLGCFKKHGKCKKSSDHPDTNSRGIPDPPSSKANPPDPPSTKADPPSPSTKKTPPPASTKKPPKPTTKQSPPKPSSKVHPTKPKTGKPESTKNEPSKPTTKHNQPKPSSKGQPTKSKTGKPESTKKEPSPGTKTNHPPSPSKSKPHPTPTNTSKQGPKPTSKNGPKPTSKVGDHTPSTASRSTPTTMESKSKTRSSDSSVTTEPYRSVELAPSMKGETGGHKREGPIVPAVVRKGTKFPKWPSKRKPKSTPKPSDGESPRCLAVPSLADMIKIEQQNKGGAKAPRSIRSLAPVLEDRGYHVPRNDDTNTKLRAVLKLPHNTNVNTESAGFRVWFDNNDRSAGIGTGGLCGCTVTVISSPYATILVHTLEQRADQSVLPNFWDSPNDPAQQRVDLQFMANTKAHIQGQLNNFNDVLGSSYQSFFPKESTSITIVSPRWDFLNPHVNEGIGQQVMERLQGRNMYPGQLLDLESDIPELLWGTSGATQRHNVNKLTYRRRSGSGSNPTMYNDDIDVVFVMPVNSGNRIVLRVFYDDDQYFDTNYLS